METSITWLTRLISGQSEEDWKQLNNIYGPLIARWLARAGVPTSDREDVRQDILMVVARRVHEFQHRHAGAFRGWLRAILSNRLKQYFTEKKHQYCRIQIEDLKINDSRLSREHDLEHDEHLARRAMHIVRHDFSIESWQAFELLVLRGHEPRHVAAQLKTSVNAVIKSKARILKRIRKELSDLLD